MTAATELYKEIAKELNITVLELRNLITQGYPLVHAYYEYKYNWNPKTDNPPW